MPGLAEQPGALVPVTVEMVVVVRPHEVCRRAAAKYQVIYAKLPTNTLLTEAGTWM